MEMIERMRKRLWLLGMVGLVVVGLLVACGSNYDPSQDGLVVIGSQGAGLLETFSFTLSNGHISAIANSPFNTANEVCVLPGLPSSMVMEPSGLYAYVILNQNSTCPGSKTGIQAFKLGSDGSVTAVGSLITDPNPMALSMDPAGKFLFVAEGQTANPVSVYAIGSGATLTAVPQTFALLGQLQTPNIAAVAATPTVFPAIGINGTQHAVCSTQGENPPTSEYLYAVDSQNYVVWEFSLNQSTGVLTSLQASLNYPPVATDQVPLGIAVDPCDRFVYVSNSLTNKVSEYTICNGLVTQSSTCASALQPGSLIPVAGSPVALSGSVNGVGPIVVDPYGNNVYVVGTFSNTVSALKISPISGSLSALTPPTVATGLRPTSIVIRGDDNWMFVTDFNQAEVSQYSITPATGALTAVIPIQTDNYPWGVAVK
jgi:6-phosphogluconolactonase (cycloisomerase 2 family)